MLSRAEKMAKRMTWTSLTTTHKSMIEQIEEVHKDVEIMKIQDELTPVEYAERIHVLAQLKNTLQSCTPFIEDIRDKYYND